MVHRLIHYFKRKNRLEAKIKEQEKPNRGTQFESDNRTVVTTNGENNTAVGTRNSSTKIEKIHKISRVSAFESDLSLSIYNPILNQNRNLPHAVSAFIDHVDYRNMELIEQKVISTPAKRKKHKITHTYDGIQKQIPDLFQLPIHDKRNLGPVGCGEYKNEGDTHNRCNPLNSKREMDLRDNNSIMPPSLFSHVDRTKITPAQNYFQLLQNKYIKEIFQRRNMLLSPRTSREKQEVHGPDQTVHNDFPVRNSPTFTTHAQARNNGTDRRDALFTPGCTKKPSFQTLKIYQEDLGSHPWKRKQKKRKRNRERPSLFESPVPDIYRVDLEYEDDAFKLLKGSSGEMRTDSDHTESITADTMTINSNATLSSTSSNHANYHQREQSELFSTLLYDNEDENVLTDYQCELRKHLEIFEASVNDVKVSASPGRRGQIVPGQIGIRCVYCAKSGPLAGRTKGALNFSKTIEGMYQVAQNIAKVHLCGNCCMIPLEVKQRLNNLRRDFRRAKGGKEYWARSISRLGIYLSEDKVMRAMQRNRHNL